MTLDVLYFAWLRERVGAPRERVKTAAATVRDLVAELAARDDRHAAALADLAALGIDRILTSGGQPTGLQGRERLRELQAHAAGKLTILGCGGLRPEYRPGTPVLISDHLNLTGASPLTGAHFVDLTDLYSPRIRGLAREVDPSLDEGVYLQLPGPHYETPAEIRMARTLGADLVGMSTTLEAIAARAAGLEVFGISLVTNLAAGISENPLNHQEVLEEGRNAGPRISRLLAQIVERL